MQLSASTPIPDAPSPTSSLPVDPTATPGSSAGKSSTDFAQLFAGMSPPEQPKTSPDTKAPATTAQAGEAAASLFQLVCGLGGADSAAALR